MERKKGKTMIQEIATEKLKIHPKNVRKTYTGIEELADSIKAKGILQNLTVVKAPDDPESYWVVIGNRRLTAARAAGLKTLPCAVVEMSEKDQVSTMLLENMQRNDLSVCEQAQGFQLMLDFGETEATISEKTGFSRTTVRHRLNLAKLDQELLAEREENEGFQLSLTDLYELEKVKDIEERNKILAHASNSRDLKWSVERTVKEEKENQAAGEIAAKLEEMGVKAAPKKAKDERWSGKWEDVGRIILSTWGEECNNTIDLPETTDQLYYYRYYSDIYVVKKQIKKDPALSEAEKRRKQVDQNKKKIKSILEEMRKVRNSFVLGIAKGTFTVPKGYDVQADLWKLCTNIICRHGLQIYRSSLYEFYGIDDKYETKEEEKDRILSEFKALSQEKQMMILISGASEPYEPTDYWGYYNDDMEQLRDFYKILERYGFSFGSLEEMKVLNGTHELYTKGEDDAK